MKLKNLTTSQKNFLVYLLFSISLLIIVILYSFVFHLSNNYNKIYKMPENKNTVIDYSNYDINDFVISTNMVGEFEFYYNKWIIADDYQGKPDSIVKVPHRWNGTIIDGKKLDNSGYASYKCYITGLPDGTKFQLELENYIGAYRAYVNGVCCTEYGTMEKTAEGKSNGAPEIERYYEVVSSKDVLEIVLEISNSQEGGLHAAPWLNLESSSVLYWAANNFGYIMLGIMIMLFFLTIIINLTQLKNEKYWSFSALIFIILLQFFFSSDVYRLICKAFDTQAYNIIANVNYVLGIPLVAIAVYHLVKINVLKLSKPLLIFYGVLTLFCSIAYFLLVGNALRIVPILILALPTCYFLFPLIKGIVSGIKINIFYASLFIISFIAYLNTMLDLLDVISFGLEIVSSLILFISVLITSGLYLLTMKKNTSRVIDSLIIKEENRTIRTEALRAQIKPHFIFNNLTNIQNLYKQDSKMGDEALMRFSKHLRINVEAEGKDSIPFKQELENIINYCELENMRRQNKINLMLDCDEYNFCLPILSLQPFIENAFKYSEVDEKPDGFVEIKSYKLENKFIVEINDNGKGFDKTKIKPGSIGLKNATERLKLISNADVEINSDTNGTQIKITFLEVSQ